MSMVKEVFYLAHDNTVDLLLKADGVAVSLTTVSKITLSFDDTLLEATNITNDPVRWVQSGYDTGEIRLFLKGKGLDAGHYRVPIVVYSPDNLDGIVWGFLLLKIVADPEAT